MRITVCGLTALACAAVAAGQDKPINWTQVQSNMNRLKSYNFSIKGGPEDLEGTFEKSSLYLKSQGFQVAGKGALTHGRADGEWTTLSMLLHVKKNDEKLLRLSRMPAPREIVGQIAQLARKIEGDGVKGFTGDFTQAILTKMVRTPWLEVKELQGAGHLEGRFAFSCQGGIVIKADLQVKGNKIEYERRHYQGTPDPSQPPPVPPGPTWKLAPDGYWYEGVEKPVVVNFSIEIKDPNNATIAQEVRSKIGLK
jgi:hypothetical protein